MNDPGPAVPPSEPGCWRVTVNMPAFERKVQLGPAPGTLVGWLNMNDPLPATVHTEARRLWRRATWAALKAARLPQGLDRIHIRIEFRFPPAARIRDLRPNYEPTAKPIVDAFQPHREYKRKAKGKIQNVVHWGVGMVAGDDPRYVVYDLAEGPALDAAKAKYLGGQVVLTITPLPALEAAA